MDKITLSASILAGIGIVGIVILLLVGSSADVLIPIVTALVGFVIGKREPQIMGLFKK